MLSHTRIRRVEICGGIAAGKTTLAQALEQDEWLASFEAFQENPFWQAFYKDPVCNAFETEISFLLQHYHQIKKVGRSCASVLVCDYSLLLDRAYASTTLAGAELPAFLSVYNVVTKRLPPPIVIVHLQCDADEEFSRIACRGREAERTATRDLLVRLNMAIEQQLAAPTLDIAIVRIDSHRLDFTERGADREQVVAKIKHAVSCASAAC